MALYSGQYIEENEPSVSTESLKQTQVRRSVKVAGLTSVVIGLLYLLWRILL